MATKRNGEKYLGNELHIPLSQDGQVMAYVWPVRALNVRGSWCGGPTIGIDVGNEEIIRFDCHDKPGHWHGGGYDKLGTPGASHRDFPKGIEAVDDQVNWSLEQVSQRTTELLSEANHGEAAEAVDSSMLQSAISQIRSHLEQQAGLRDEAISAGIIDA